MTQLNQAFRFRQSCLAAAVSLLLAPSAYALQDLPDETLSDTTGEGIALLPENFKFVFQGPNDVSGASSYGTLKDKASLQLASKNDTGFIRIIPKGENYDLLYSKLFSKGYDQAYKEQKVYAQQNFYKTQYDASYKTEYDKVWQNGSTTSKTYTDTYAVNKTKYTDIYTNQVVQTFLSQKTYSDYYNSRYDYYMAIIWSGAFLDKEKSSAAALNDTVNKIKSEKASDITTGVNNKLKETTLNDIKALADKTAALLADKAATGYVENYAAKAGYAAGNISGTGLKSQRTKADVFIYGLALSKSNSDMNQRYSNEGVNWGSADNPWLFRAGTAKNIRQFNGANVGDIGYLALEAPLAKVGGNSSSDRLKLGFWTDIFSRALDSSDSINPVTGAPSSGLDKDYRLRAQVIANGLSIDGSQVRIFQTQSSSVAQQNQTLGMASILRINTNDDPSALKFTDADLDAKGLRISTAVKTDADDGALATPALEAGAKAPLFNDVEGLYLYSTNINLVLGNMYQPFILGSEGSNIILEVTRIPNIPDIYKKIYTYYADTDASNTNLTAAQKAEYLGSTCNVAQCGTAIQNASGQAIYQGNNATHSSISIGSVTRDSATNMLKANRDASATGVVFKSPGGNAVYLGSAVIDGVLIQHLKIKTTGL